MNRLTYELGHKGSNEYEPTKNKDMPINDYITCVNKLGKLEDLEEELGCPLDVLFKALKDGVYYSENFDNPVLVLNEDNFKDNNFRLLVIGTTLYLKDYKKTWWLRKDKSE